MLSKLDVITFKGSGGCVFTVDNFFFAVQVCSPVYRHYKVPAGDIQKDPPDATTTYTGV